MTNSREGALRIGDSWNAITIIALSQNNPLKAIAEFVENGLDAGAKHITIVRGRDRGRQFLRITDDGAGIHRDPDGVPDFRYVATHICDSLKRRLKREGATGVQGEFGIGLLSFWTVGGELTLTSAGADGKAWQMRLKRGEPDFAIRHARSLFAARGTDLLIAPLLPGLRALTGEKISWYLAAELRDRIRTTGAAIRVLDRNARREYPVEPRQFNGRLLHNLPALRSAQGEIYCELYLNPPDPVNTIGLFRNGTRVLDDIARLPQFAAEPWAAHCLQGIIDVPFLQLTPGTRDGVIQDAAYSDALAALAPLAKELNAAIAAQRQAADEQASRDTLRTVQRALREALMALPAEEYDWFSFAAPRGGRSAVVGAPAAESAIVIPDAAGGAGFPAIDGEREEPAQMSFFEHAGPLYSARITPASAVVRVGTERALLLVARDKRRRRIERALTVSWRIIAGGGTLSATDRESITYSAPAEPGLTRIAVTVSENEVTIEAECLLTVTEELVSERGAGTMKGLPSYTFQSAPGELWRSRYDSEKNVVVVNSGHRDFVYAARSGARKVRYVCRLFSKELVVHNFPGLPAEQLLERFIELSLYTEENL